MAWGNRPCFCGDSLLCRSGLPVSGIDFGTGRDMNLHCGATRPLCRERCVQRSLPCVGNSDRRTTYRLRPRAKYDRSLKFFLQKRIRNGVTPGWKSPRLSHRGAGGIAVRTKWQSGFMTGNIMAQHRTGNRLIGNERCAVGKSYPYLSRKINPRRCPVQYFLMKHLYFCKAKRGIFL